MMKTKFFLLAFVSLLHIHTYGQEEDYNLSTFLCTNVYVWPVDFVINDHQKEPNETSRKITRALNLALSNRAGSSVLERSEFDFLRERYEIEQLFDPNKELENDVLYKEFYQVAKMIVTGELRSATLQNYSLEIEFRHLGAIRKEVIHKFHIPKNYLPKGQDYDLKLDSLMEKEMNQVFLGYRNKALQSKNTLITGRVSNNFGTTAKITIQQIPNQTFETNSIGYFYIELPNRYIGKGEKFLLTLYDNYRRKDIKMELSSYRMHLKDSIDLPFEKDVHITVPVSVTTKQGKLLQVDSIQIVSEKGDTIDTSHYQGKDGKYYFKISAQKLLKHTSIRIRVIPRKKQKYDPKERSGFDTSKWLRELIQKGTEVRPIVSFLLGKTVYPVKNNYFTSGVLHQQPLTTWEDNSGILDKVGGHLSFHTSLSKNTSKNKAWLLGGNLHYFSQTIPVSYPILNTTYTQDYKIHQIQAELSLRYMVRYSRQAFFHAGFNLGNQVYARQKFPTFIDYHAFLNQFRPGGGIQLGWGYKFIGVEIGYFRYYNKYPLVHFHEFKDSEITFTDGWSGLFSTGLFFIIKT